MNTHSADRATDTAADTATRLDYLARLDAANTALPHGIALELHEGVAEELANFAGAELAARIAELGPPELVAHAALAQAEEQGAPQYSQRAGGYASTAPGTGTGTAPGTAQHTPTQLPLAETRGYALAAATIMGGGSLIVPGVGWLIGAVLVASSKLWHTREKVWAILMPFLVMLIIAAAIALVSLISGSPGSESPLRPAAYDGIATTLLTGVLTAPFAAMWLVKKLRKREKLISDSGVTPEILL